MLNNGFKSRHVIWLEFVRHMFCFSNDATFQEISKRKKELQPGQMKLCLYIKIIDWKGGKMFG